MLKSVPKADCSGHKVVSLEHKQAEEDVEQTAGNGAGLTKCSSGRNETGRLVGWSAQDLGACCM